MSKLKALVMHHNILTQNITKKLLEDRQFEVIILKDEEDLEKTLHEHDFALALIRSNFVQAIKELKNDKYNTFVIGLTPTTSPRKAFKLEDSGVNRVLLIPINEYKLDEILADVPKFQENVKDGHK